MGSEEQGSNRFDREEGLKFMKLNSRISVMLSSEEMACKVEPGLCLDCRLIEPHSEYSFKETDENIASLSLEEMFRFDGIMRSLVQQQEHHVVVCTGVETNRQARTLMLLGCHMVMSQGMAFEETLLSFRPQQSLIQSHFRGVLAFEVLLRAVCCAKCLNWIDFGLDMSESAAESGIQMDEFIHYARSH